MSKEQLVQKNLKLSADFNGYILDHPSLIGHLPKDFCVVFEVKGDTTLSKRNLSIAEQMTKRGERCYVASKSGARWQIKKISSKLTA